LAADADGALPATHHLLYLAGRALPAAIGFVAIIAYSHLFDLAVYGEYAIILAFANIVIGSVLVWIRITMTRYAATPGPMADRMIGVALALQAAVSIALLVLFGLGAALMQSATPLLIVFAALAMSWSDLNLDLLRARHAVGRFSLQYLIRQLLSVAAVLVALTIDVPWNPIVIGLIVGNLLSNLSLVRQILPRPAFRFTRADLATFTTHGLPLSVNYFVASLTLSLDRLIIGWVLGREAAGAYALVADIVVQLLGVVMDGVTLAFLPYAARSMDQNGKQAAAAVLHQNLLVLLGVGMPAAFGLAVCGPGLAELVLGGDFSAAALTLFPILALANLLRGVRVFFLENVFQIFGRIRLATRMTTLAAILLAVGTLVMLPLFGLESGAIASLVSSAAALVLGLWLARPLLDRPYPIGDVLRITFASICSAGAALAMVVALPGGAGLAPAIVIGVAAYAVALWFANPDDLQARIRGAVASRRARG